MERRRDVSPCESAPFPGKKVSQHLRNEALGSNLKFMNETQRSRGDPLARFSLPSALPPLPFTDPGRHHSHPYSHLMWRSGRKKRGPSSPLMGPLLAFSDQRGQGENGANLQTQGILSYLYSLANPSTELPGLRSLWFFNEDELVFGCTAYGADCRRLQSLIDITAHNAAPAFHVWVSFGQDGVRSHSSPSAARRLSRYIPRSVGGGQASSDGPFREPR